MFEEVRDALGAAIGSLAIPVDTSALAECVAMLDRLTAKVASAVGEVDRAGLWEAEGATSMTAWLKATGCSGRTARSLVQVGKRLGDLPVLAAAYHDGTMSTGQVQAIVANLSDDTTPLFAWVEAELVPTLAAVPVRDVSRAMQAWARAAGDALTDPTAPAPAPPERSLYLSRTLAGRRELHGSFDPEASALADVALRVAESDDVEGEPRRSPAQRRADALVDILRFFLDHQQSRRGGRHRPHLNVFLDYDALVRRAGSAAAGTSDPCVDDIDDAGVGVAADATGPPGVDSLTGWLGDGTVLDAATLRRLACDAGVHRVVAQGRSSILDYGHTTRTTPANIFNALVARDQHCRFGTCGRPPEWCEAHHVVPWEQRGPTAIGNLVLACSRHHHLVHQAGWHATLAPDGTLTVRNPHGRWIVSRPPGKPLDLFDNPHDRRDAA